MSPKNQNSDLRPMVEGALCVALSVVLSSIKIFALPQGGSITLEMLPLLLIAYRWGMRWGIIAGVLSGLLQLLFGGFFAHPLQALLDYPVAFGCIGLAGFSSSHRVISTLIAGTARLSCHVLAGVIFFAAYAPTGQNVWLYSLIYNATFMIPSLAISIVLAWIIERKMVKIQR